MDWKDSTGVWLVEGKFDNFTCLCSSGLRHTLFAETDAFSIDKEEILEAIEGVEALFEGLEPQFQGVVLYLLGLDMEEQDLCLKRNNRCLVKFFVIWDDRLHWQARHGLKVGVPIDDRINVLRAQQDNIGY